MRQVANFSDSHLTTTPPTTHGWDAVPALLMRARWRCHTPSVYETEAIVLRSIRYGEADSVLTLYTQARGRVHLGLHEGRGDMQTVRQAQIVEGHAGLWMEGYRLRASGSILEAAMRILIEEEPNEGAYNLLCRGLGLLAKAPPTDLPPRHDSIVLGVHAKLLVVAGLLPRLGSCCACDSPGPLVAFSARMGGALCTDHMAHGEPVDAAVFAALAHLLGSPLADLREPFPRGVADGVERLIGLVLREHLGVVLRSNAPL
jgi:DNA repair protein RecO (recombination protein O)